MISLTWIHWNLYVTIVDYLYHSIIHTSFRHQLEPKSCPLLTKLRCACYLGLCPHDSSAFDTIDTSQLMREEQPGKQNYIWCSTNTTYGKLKIIWFYKGPLWLGALLTGGLFDWGPFWLGALLTWGPLWPGALLVGGPFGGALLVGGPFDWGPFWPVTVNTNYTYYWLHYICNYTFHVIAYQWSYTCIAFTKCTSTSNGHIVVKPLSCTPQGVLYPNPVNPILHNRWYHTPAPCNLLICNRRYPNAVPHWGWGVVLYKGPLLQQTSQSEENHISWNALLSVM
jgi:hypothetical protein